MKILANILIVITFFFLGFTIKTGCNGKQIPQKPDTVKTTDTVFVPHDTTIYRPSPKVKEVIHDTIPGEYLPDTAYPLVKAQYEKLLKEHFAKVIQEDTLPIGTIGTISIQDTLQANKIQKRNYKVSYEVQTITNTITITKPAPAVNQLYFGGSIHGNKRELNLVQTGLLYKTKNDKLMGALVSINPEGKLSYGIQLYWKLK